MDYHRKLKQNLPASTSHIISLLRFPLIVGIVFIHTPFPDSTLTSEAASSLPLYNCSITLFSYVVPRVCVPLFFLFAGYLFYYGVKNFSTSFYLQRLRSRFRSLLIPYLFWNLLLYGTVILIRNRVSLYNGSFDVPFPQNLWSAQIDETKLSGPIVMQFWFIRDLMVCVAISPLIYWLNYHTRHFGIILLAAAWFVGLEIPVVWRIGANMLALFFFSLGAWLARYRRDLAALAWDLRFLGLLWPMMIAFVFVFYTDIDSTGGRILWNLMVMTGIIFAMCFAAWLVEKKSIRAVPLLTSSTFFLFAFHNPWGSSPLRRLMFALFQPDSDLDFAAIYFLSAVLTVVMGVGLYYLLSLMFPRVTSIVTGGR